MFRHARQLDLARRLNHADRKERILISLETSREILFVKEHGPLFFPSPSRLLPASPTFRTFSLLLLPRALLSPTFLHLFALLRIVVVRSTLRKYLSSDFFLSPTSKPEAKGRNCFFSPTITSSGTLDFFPFLSSGKNREVATKQATSVDDSLRNFPLARGINPVCQLANNHQPAY